jgi:acetyl/propionyl-CoA carboxylase alpha subunit
MGEASVKVARACGYVNAGTVEFLYQDGEFFFLEMNTRLQVEHPVTEMTTGLDLVAEQIRAAAGLPLPFRQDDVMASGHALELRLYAESPSRGFTPTTGRVLALHWPAGEGVRVDSGIVAGQRITTAFDPMLAKLVVHAPDRATALARASAALQQLVLLGCETNAAFLRRILADERFARNDVHTGYLEEIPALAEEPAPDGETLRKLLAVAALLSRPVRDAAEAVPALHAAIGGWRN